MFYIGESRHSRNARRFISRSPYRFRSPAGDPQPAPAPGSSSPVAQPLPVTGGTPTGTAGASQEQSGKPAGETPVSDVAKLQAELEKTQTALREANAEAAKRRHEQKRLEQAKADADAKALIDAQEWEKAAKLREAELTELRTTVTALTPKVEELTATVERYAKALNSHLATLKTSLPAHVIKLLERLDPADQLAYIAENAEALKPVTTPAATQSAGIPATPKPADGQTVSDEEKRRKREAASVGMMRQY